MYSFVLSSLVLLLLIGMGISSPVMQKITINNHVWEVPDGPEWEEIIKEAEIIRKYLEKCTTPAECRQVFDLLRSVLYRHPVSKTYFESNKDDYDEILDSVFKWGR